MKENNKIVSLIFRETDVHQNGINRLRFYNNNLYTAGRDGIVRSWDHETLGLTRAFNNHIHWVNDIEFSGDLMFACSSDTKISIWNLNSECCKKPDQSLLIHGDYIHSLKFIDNLLYSAGEDGLIFKIEPDYSSSKFTAYNSSIWSIDCTDSLLAVGLSSRVAKILDRRDQRQEFDLRGHGNYIRKISLNPNGKEAITCSSDHTIRLWDIGTRKTIEIFSMHASSVFSLACDWENGFFLSGDKTGAVFEVNHKTHEARQICQEKAQITDLVRIDQEIWVSTIESDLSSYKNFQKFREIKGVPRLVDHKTTDNKKNIVTKDSSNNVKSYSLLENKIEYIEEPFKNAVKKLNIGKNSNAWFLANIRLGCLMVEINQNDCLSATEVINSALVNYGELLLSKVFYYIIVHEEKILKEKDGFSKNRFLLPSECGYENVTVVVSNIKTGGIPEPIIFSTVKDIVEEYKCQLPFWIQKIIFKVNKL